MSSPLPLCPSAIGFSFLFRCISRPEPVPAQQKTPWPFGAGGCERTRCGVRRQVSSRSNAVAFVTNTSITPIRLAGRASTLNGRAEAQRFPPPVGGPPLQHAKPGIKRVGRLPPRRPPPLRMQGRGVVDTHVG